MIGMILDWLGDAPTLWAAGALVGVLFGAMAERSQFCLRAATIEISQGRLGPRFSVWLLAFFAALLAVQGAVIAEFLDVNEARQLAVPGSLSGAIIGGLMFGAGMILARGCVSRLLVLSATGNLRALMTGLVITITAQAALRGVLSPLRETIAGLSVLPGGSARSLLVQSGLAREEIALVALLGLALGWILAWRRGIGIAMRLTGIGVGLAVALGWVLTWHIAQASFEPVSLTSVTFTGPSTDTLMALIARPDINWSFGLGLVPGVVLGAGCSALLAGRWQIARFGHDTPMERYLIGAVLMGFGSILAGGCAVGAGVAGGSILALTAWVAVFSMWIGALLTQWIGRY